MESSDQKTRAQGPGGTISLARTIHQVHGPASIPGVQSRGAMLKSDDCVCHTEAVGEIGCLRENGRCPWSPSVPALRPIRANPGLVALRWPGKSLIRLPKSCCANAVWWTGELSTNRSHRGTETTTGHNETVLVAYQCGTTLSSLTRCAGVSWYH